MLGSRFRAGKGDLTYIPHLQRRRFRDYRVDQFQNSASVISSSDKTAR